MTKFLPAICWALLMILFAVLARVGLADRNAVMTLLLIMPILAVVTMQRKRGCCGVARDA